jgi:hypothetical protein
MLALAACSDDGGPPPPPANPGFTTPTAITMANERVGGVWTEMGPADWTCLNTASSDQPSVSIMLSGVLDDFQSGNAVGGATITAFPGIMTTANSGQATSSNEAATRGDYAMTVTAHGGGETRTGFVVTATGYLKTYLLNQYLNPANPTQTLGISAISEGTANALPAFIGVTRLETDGVLAGAFRDCQGREVSNAVATVSSTPTTVNHLEGAATYYFSAAANSLPVRHSQSAHMNKDGLFVILALKPQAEPAYVQIWGFRDAAELGSGDMTLLSELASPVEANAVITGSFEPLRN